MNQDKRSQFISVRKYSEFLIEPENFVWPRAAVDYGRLGMTDYGKMVEKSVQESISLKTG